MTAVILKSAPYVEEIREDILREVGILKSREIAPRLDVVLVGEDPGSVWYANSKAKIGAKLGIEVEIHKLPSAATQEEVHNLVIELNNDESVHGILVELPLPKHLDKSKILNAILPVKDVDGVTAANRGFILGGQEEQALIAATPLSCIELIARAGVDLRGKRVTLVGRGDTVGRPLSMLLIKRDATITVCHTKTVNLAEECLRAEVLVAAAGARNLVTREMVSPGTVVIDAGVNETEDGGFTGDVDFGPVSEVAGAITPVPGGVGSLTTTLLMRNVLRAIELQGLN
ncbi:MAG: bifunctional 5,10-methylenetetrahydrofolate dehydrogenase/5,10-methenyltetrahydrofolate cyclohydrolase [Candidatus Omnitrophica bacterium]|nr:bifunctional 5,10-methylenetetrahydrofolate dehydrogenase/5,10-methenyltetrahydrofolate cyclohydrolase [Candidatus Omnitrophota bacterium]